MDKRREGKPGDARAALRRSIRDNGSVFFINDILLLFAFLIDLISIFHFILCSCHYLILLFKFIILI